MSTNTEHAVTAMNRFEQARQRHQFEMLSRSVELQEEAIVNHYVAFANLAMQLRTLVNQRKLIRSEESDDLIRFLVGKIKQGHLMEFGIQLEWPICEAARKGSDEN